MSQSPEELAELPCDFTAYLQQRLGVDRHAAEVTLADWIAGYQPQRLHAIHVLERRRCETLEPILEADAA